MQFSIATIAAVAGLAAAAPHGHEHFHKKDLDVAGLMDNLEGFLSHVGVAQPAAPKGTNGQGTWVGEEGPVVNTIMNKADSPVTVVFWGPQGSWINKIPAQMAQVIQPGQNLTVSHAMGSGWTPNTGGMSALYPDTKMVNGQISNVWYEYSYTNDMYSSSTYDVSMEPNMKGHNMTIEGPKCTSDFNRCVFKCKDASQTTCGEAGEYELVNCEQGSQPGASSGLWGGQASGGCQGISNTGITNLVTTLH